MSVILPISFYTSTATHYCRFFASRSVHVRLQDDELVEWLAKRGVSTRVSIGTVDGLRGLEAAHGSVAGDVLLSVPIDHVLCSVEGPSNDHLPGAAPGWTAALPRKVQLAVQYLSLMADPASEWSPYLASWPTAVPELPTDEEVLAISTGAARVVDADAEAWRRTWARSTTRTWITAQHAVAMEAHEAAHGGQSSPFHSLEVFSAAVRLVGSRCLRLSAGPYGARSFLVPMLDMANHDGCEPSAFFAYSPERACIELVARGPINAGDAVTISYGEHTNAEFARAYGFVPRDNPHDCEVVSLQELLRAAQAAGALRVDDIEAIVAAVDSAGLPTLGLRLFASAPAEETILALRAAFAPDGGASLAEVLEAIAMDMFDEDDIDDDDDAFDDALAAECAALLAAACTTLEAACGSQEDELQRPELSSSMGLLCELRGSRMCLLRSLRRNMEAVGTSPLGARAALGGQQNGEEANAAAAPGSSDRGGRSVRMTADQGERSGDKLSADAGPADTGSADGAVTRRGALRAVLLAGWAVGAGSSVGRLLDFPPPSFRALATEVYADAQAAAAPAAAAASRRLRVLEIGSGVGLSSVFEDRFLAGSEVLALDVDAPSAGRLKAAQARAVEHGFELRFTVGDATDLRTIPADSVDVVVCSLTLCSVPSCEAAVAEVHRVLRPGGSFGFVEHVRVLEADDLPTLALSQTVLDPLQQVIAHGCHLRRDTPQVIVDAFGAASVRRLERSVEESMWPVSQLAAGVVSKV